MPRHKEYDENIVVEKAMNLFWEKGYKSASMKMLEEATGINKFGIYSSFGSKKGLFLAGLKLYRKQVETMFEKLQASENGLLGIKQYFYDFLDFSKRNKSWQGCMMSNTAHEFGIEADPLILAEVIKYHAKLKALFENNLAQETFIKKENIEKKADALIIGITGMTNASKFSSQKQLHNFIEVLFE